MASVNHNYGKAGEKEDNQNEYNEIEPDYTEILPDESGYYELKPAQPDYIELELTEQTTTKRYEDVPQTSAKGNTSKSSGQSNQSVPTELTSSKSPICSGRCCFIFMVISMIIIIAVVVASIAYFLTKTGKTLFF